MILDLRFKDMTADEVKEFIQEFDELKDKDYRIFKLKNGSIRFNPVIRKLSTVRDLSLKLGVDDSVSMSLYMKNWKASYKYPQEFVEKDYEKLKDALKKV